MGENKRISERELKLILVLLSIAIVISSFQLGFVKYNDRTDEIELSNIELEEEVNQLKDMHSKKEIILNEIEEMTIESDEIISKFPARLSQEKNTIFVDKLEKKVDVSVSSISFQETEVFYPSTGNLAESEISEEVKTNDDSGDVALIAGEEKTGYKTGITISYITTYKGLKECADYIKNEYKAVHLNDISAAFDPSTGKLTGTMTMQMFALDGYDIKEEELKIDNIKTGVENIFGKGW